MSRLSWCEHMSQLTDSDPQFYHQPENTESNITLACTWSLVTWSPPVTWDLASVSDLSADTTDTTQVSTFIHHLHNNPGCQSGMKLCKNV